MRKLLLFICLCLATASVIVGCKHERVGTAFDRFLTVPEPRDAKLLDEVGDISLFAVKTAEDAAYDEKMRESGNPMFVRRSLFTRWLTEVGTNEWRVIMAAGGDWKIAEGMDEWCADRAKEARSEFDGRNASGIVGGEEQGIG